MQILGFLFMGLGFLCALGMFACFIITLIALFKKEGVGLGILGIFCGIYTYIWGWMNIKTVPGIQKIIYAWTGLLVAYIVFYGIGAAILAMTLPSSLPTQ